jgi:hypothetical protein
MLETGLFSYDALLPSGLPQCCPSHPARTFIPRANLEFSYGVIDVQIVN